MKKRWIRGLAVFTGVVLLAGFVALNVLARNHARAMLYYSGGGARTSPPEELSFGGRLGTLLRGVNLPRPDGRRTPLDIGLDYEDLVIDPAGGARLAAWYCPNGDASPLVVLFHGYGGDKSTLLGEAAAVYELGCSALLVDFRGSGGSSESYTTLGMLEGEDVAAVWSYVRERWPERRVLLYGQSMGAAAVLRAIAHEEGVAPHGIVLEAVFDNMLRTVRNRFNAMRVPSFPNAELLLFWGGREFGFNAFRHNPEEYARRVRCPVLFFHGAEDPRARLVEAERVFAAIPGDVPSRLVVFEHIGHSSAVAHDKARWQEAWREFF